MCRTSPARSCGSESDSQGAANTDLSVCYCAAGFLSLSRQRSTALPLAGFELIKNSKIASADARGGALNGPDRQAPGPPHPARQIHKSLGHPCISEQTRSYSPFLKRCAHRRLSQAKQRRNRRVSTHPLPWRSDPSWPRYHRDCSRRACRPRSHWNWRTRRCHDIAR